MEEQKRRDSNEENDVANEPESRMAAKKHSADCNSDNDDNEKLIDRIRQKLGHHITYYCDGYLEMLSARCALVASEETSHPIGEGIAGCLHRLGPH
ncbi:hypothetical protein OIU34_08755 [Pararhizobium sp. BT-229]|uniref:hypothetical protein n=1 Tax=Pararhizobium sp. BT-229 TaxID=2986923 RepID=UPI0021F70710|nr:hypothetical protein [Pararhizobium sp. BT-229]MCV9961986.1 hypothetical protein [Pararhizobium sp. BT-229]